MELNGKEGAPMAVKKSEKSEKTAKSAKQPMAAKTKSAKDAPAMESKSVEQRAVKTPEEAGAKRSAGKPAEYGDHSITQLKGADRVRKRPAVIFGSDGLEGCQHAVFEIVSNSVDEAKEGHGDTIVVTRFADWSVQVEDCGRGVPMGYNEREGQFNWYLIFCELYAGGKYENNTEGANYGYALGLNGLGACATQCASAYMEVRSYRDGMLSEMHFKKGEPDGEFSQTPLAPRDKKHGTIIRWLPDLDVFTDIAIPKDYYVDMLKRQAVVNSGVHFILKNEVSAGKFESEEFYYENGIVDRVRELAGGTELTDPAFYKTETMGRDREDQDDYKLKVEISFCISNKLRQIEYYHNSSWLEHGGSPERATKQAFASALNKYIRNTNKFKKGESQVLFSDVAECLILVVNSYSTKTSYENQTKKAVTNSFIAEFMTEWFKKTLAIYFTEHPAEAERIANQVLINKRSREKANEIKLDVKKKLSASMDVANRVEKFVCCRSKDPERREVYIVEGDSALGSCKISRNAEFQALFAVRGKTLNCMKAGYDRIFASDVIVNMLRVIGCGVELEGKNTGDLSTFDLKNFKWSKVIICTDADEDGFQIRTLILTVFYRLLPTLIELGKVYIAETPLYEITVKDDTYFAYNEKEKAEILASLEGKKYTLQRSKGLGENDAEMMSKTTMNPATRRLIRVSPSDAAATAQIFETLLGDDLEGRKRFIAENGRNYMNVIDV